MKKLLLLLLLILIGCSKEPINMNEVLIERHGVYYRKDTNEIYSGPVFSLYLNGQLFQEGTLNNGKLDGPYKSYHDNGQLEGEGTFNNGLPDGPFKEYHSNGQLRLEETYKDDKLDGPVKSYHENGQLEGEGTYKDGKKDGLFVWYDINGKIEYEGTYKDDKKWNGSFKKSDTLWITSESMFYKNGNPVHEPVDKDGNEIFTYNHSPNDISDFYRSVVTLYGEKLFDFEENDKGFKIDFVDGELISKYSDNMKKYFFDFFWSERERLLGW